ncbi:hypothetical protein [Streptomyces californicus]|uniref:hypothetical protein n=1 Tax=Streptomyces californicus TaxID=67351 RepID=UPI0004C25E98|nr:hypothetical protein [Streptomyces californicus]QRV59332.1 hypothetical protein I6J40_34290 [Streptomyces californicus]
MAEPIVTTTRHEVSIFPLDDINRRAFTLYVERLRYRRPGEGEWRVIDGVYGYNERALPDTDVRDAPGFDETTALGIAKEAARHIVVNGMSATEVYDRTRPAPEGAR